MTPADALIAGHICVDLVPALGEGPRIEPGRLIDIGPLDVRTGGCVANTGLDLAALGSPVRLVADVGDDPLGAMLVEMLRRPRVDPGLVRAVAGLSTSYSVVVQPPGDDRTIWHHPGANDAFDATGVELAGERLLHVGYPTILRRLYSDDGAGLAELLSSARSAGVTTSVDLSTVDRSSAAGDRDWWGILQRILSATDVFAPSLDDLAAALDRDLDDVHAVRALAGELLEAGAGIVMLKAGPRGLYLRTAGRDRLRAAGAAIAGQADAWADRELWAGPPPVEVRGTTGAGDAAVAGLLHALLTGREAEDGLGLAVAAGAARVSGAGDLPGADELDRRVAGTLQDPGIDGWRMGRIVAHGPADREP